MDIVTAVLGLVAGLVIGQIAIFDTLAGHSEQSNATRMTVGVVRHVDETHKTITVTRSGGTTPVQFSYNASTRWARVLIDNGGTHARIVPAVPSDITDGTLVKMRVSLDQGAPYALLVETTLQAL